MRAFKGADLGVGISPCMLVLVTIGVWNVWHTIQQRYGILRAYAGKAKGGLEQRAHGRRDHALRPHHPVPLQPQLPLRRPLPRPGFR